MTDYESLDIAVKIDLYVSILEPHNNMKRF